MLPLLRMILTMRLAHMYLKEKITPATSTVKTSTSWKHFRCLLGHNMHKDFIYLAQMYHWQSKIVVKIMAIHLNAIQFNEETLT